ncbi:TDT family transporter [Streptococcus didelphis]|uniref:TDT family transporter n=2 Tax=Streptococcus didelphis TaxID=102886 RepID=A0ABY9LJC3_9STRE|nr:TDT family transporter [Streptococcus didelphis]WMB28843.1 TDT family transporter [Streptococcus didelphis]WMB30172.1 TDT family transporter [Streptococcus didelphis]
MTFYFKRPPLVMSGLVLGILSLGNLLGNYSLLLNNILLIVASLFYVYLLAGMVRHPYQVLEELKSPLVASVFPTFFMAGMLFSARLIKDLSFELGHFLWLIFFLGNCCLILYYLIRFLIPFSWNHVFPSWSVLFVGIAVAALTAPFSQHVKIGQFIFFACLILTFLVLPFMTYKAYFIGLESSLKPNISTFCAPLSLLLASYLAAFPAPDSRLVIFLTLTSQLLYFFVLFQLPVLIKRDFNPGFAAFTFPFVISATSLKGALTYLGLSKGFVLLLIFEILVATLLVVYVTYLYGTFLIRKKRKNNVSRFYLIYYS